MSKVMLAGYFGSGNLGDDALMLGMVEGLKPHGIEAVALTGDPTETYGQYGIYSVPRRDMKAISNELKSCDALVFPGGSIFQDVTSVKSVAYYAALVKQAKAAKKKVVMLGQGVGPLKTFMGKRLAVGAYNASEVIAVRDPEAAQALKALGVKRKVVVTADSAFLLKPRPDSGEGNFGFAGMGAVGLAPRPYGKGNEVVTLFGEIARLLFQAGVMPVLIQMDKSEDGPLLNEIQKAQGGKIPDLKRVKTPLELQAALSRMDGMISMRLHGAIFAANVGLPPLMISYDPKVSSFAKLLGTTAMPFEGLTAAKVFDRFREHQAQKEQNKKILAKKHDEFAAKARQNVDILLDAVYPALTK